MIHAYSELYIDEFQSNFGEMVDYAVVGCGIPLGEFQDRFLASGIADQIERGNPHYLVGLSGGETAVRVMEKTGDAAKSEDGYILYPGPEYWAGWALAYLQWYSGYSFALLAENGFDLESVAHKFHPYHEAPLMKFVDESMCLIKERLSKKETPLKRIRQFAGLTQKELALRSGVKLRMIQAYEQRYQDILKAESGTLTALASVLGCSSRCLMEQ